MQITATYPLDLVRTRLQLAEAAGASYRGIAHCLQDTYLREGAAALYKGLLPSMLAGVPYVGLQARPAAAATSARAASTSPLTAAAGAISLRSAGRSCRRRPAPAAAR